MTGTRSSPTDDNTLLRTVAFEIKQRWKLLIVLPIAAAILAGLLAFILPRQFDGVTIFSPAEDITSTLPGNLQAIAAQFGIAAPTSGYNVYYFSQVAQSREAFGMLLRDTIVVDGKQTAVLDVIHAKGDNPSERIDNGIRKLNKRVFVRTDDDANLVTITVRGPTPQSASALAGKLLDALNAVTSASIRLGGSAERRFAQAQADSAREALRAAENALRDFLNANRSISSSPSLQFEEARLRRQIQIREELYMALVNQAEAAKLREVRNIPSISVVQPPQASVKPAWPRPSVWAMFALVGFFTIVFAWIYVLQPTLSALIQTTPGVPRAR